MGFDRADTLRGSAELFVEITLVMRTGHILLPNGLGPTSRPDERAGGVAPNELTSSDQRAFTDTLSAGPSPHVSRR